MATLSDILQRLSLIFRTDEKTKVGRAIRPTNRSDDAKERNKSLGGGLRRESFFKGNQDQNIPYECTSTQNHIHNNKQIFNSSWLSVFKAIDKLRTPLKYFIKFSDLHGGMREVHGNFEEQIL